MAACNRAVRWPPARVRLRRLQRHRDSPAAAPLAQEPAAGSSPTPCSTSSPRPLPLTTCATCSCRPASFHPRDEYLERIEPWLGEILAGRPAQHAALVRPYATWHVLRRARRRSRGRGASTMSAAGWARDPILAALAFLAWLDDCGATLGAATQADVDTWLDGATRYRYLLRDFLTWASARRLAGQVTVPALPRSELAGFISEDSPWELLSRCLRDPGILLRRPDRRSAPAALRPVRLAPDPAHRRRHRAARPRHVPAARYRPGPPPAPARRPRPRPARRRPRAPAAAPGPRPLFPGRSPARPVAPQTLTRRLRQHGIEPRQARNSALAARATDLPPRSWPACSASTSRPPSTGPPHPPRLDRLPRRTGSARLT